MPVRYILMDKDCYFVKAKYDSYQEARNEALKSDKIVRDTTPETIKVPLWRLWAALIGLIAIPLLVVLSVHSIWFAVMGIVLHLLNIKTYLFALKYWDNE